MNISDEDVKKIAALARLRLEGDQLAKYKKEMSDIVSYVEQLSEVETKDVTPMDHVSSTETLREDQVSSEHSLEDRDLNLNTAPKTKDGYIVVPGVFE